LPGKGKKGVRKKCDQMDVCEGGGSFSMQNVRKNHPGGPGREKKMHQNEG